MTDFDSWFKKKFRDLHDAILCGDLIAGNYKKVSKKSYEAGQQSKQKEVDELIKSIDWHIEDCELRLSMNKNDYYQDGFKAALLAVKKRLE